MALTHHKSLDIFYSRLFYRLAQKQDPNRRPNQEEDTEGTGDQPVQRRKTERASKYNVQWWSVDDEYPKAGTGQDTEEIIFVSDDALAEGERKFSFDGEYLWCTG
jgi:hypothetical protein